MQVKLGVKQLVRLAALLLPAPIPVEGITHRDKNIRGETNNEQVSQSADNSVSLLAGFKYR